MTEEQKQEEVVLGICLPARDMVHTWFAYSLTLAVSYIAAKYDHVRCNLIVSNGTLIQEQRVDLAKKALASGCSWVIYVDSDMRFPKNAFEQLVKWKRPIVAANYPTRKYPFIQPVTYRSDDSDDRVYTTDDKEGLEEVASTGFGMVAVHRSVFEALPQPWFYVPYDLEKNKFDCGEDIWFCRRARENGFPVFIDHDLSKAIAHIGSIEIDHEMANKFAPLASRRRKMLEEQGGDLNCIDMSKLSAA